jgi:hypothetical protein
MMDIGKEIRTIQVDPIQTPVPARETKPQRQTRPAPDRKQPVKPTRKPAKEPAKQ